MKLTIPNLPAAKAATERVLNLIAPPPELSVSQWADRFRRLSPEASSEAGVWNTSAAEYQRGIMDAISDDSVESVVIMSCAQVGKTEMILNLVGYHIDQEPAPMLVVQPTLDMAQTFSKDRLAPMLRDTPNLKGKVKDARARDSGNTTLKKNFAGGHVTMCGANSPSSLASRPCRVVLCDEVDRFPLSAGTEGDPVELAKRRAATYHNRKFVMVSTPTVAGASRIEAEFEKSDKREYHVPCPHCGHMQTLRWSNVHWETDKPETASYACEECGGLWSDADRFRAVRRGEWRATAPFVETAGFRLNGLYSPWTSLESAVRQFLVAKRDPAQLRVFVNTFFGEVYEETGEGVDQLDIMANIEPAWQKLPEAGVLMTAGVDVQDDRLESQVIMWSRDEEAHVVDVQTFIGDPSSAGVWSDLDAYLANTWETEDGRELPIRAACIDSGGHHTQAVYKFCKPRYGRRIFAIKGVGGEGKAIVGRPSKNNHIKCPLFPIGVDTAKETIYSRLQIREAGAGYIHFPDTLDEEYFKQLTAEKVVKKYHKGFYKREWVKTRRRNEALDTFVYAYAALNCLGVSVNLIAQRSIQRAQKAETEEPKQRRRRVQQPRRGGGFVNGWR